MADQRTSGTTPEPIRAALTGNGRVSKQLLTPENCTVILIDHQPQMAFAVQSMDRQMLVNNVTGLAKAAKIFNVPTILTSVAAKTFSGPIFDEVLDVFPGHTIIDRTSMNSWEDKQFVDAVEKIGRKKLVMAALWTEVCLCMPALCALEEGYEVYAVDDASAGTSVTAHQMAMQRVTQAGAIPVSWMQVLLELQRDWARTGTYEAVGATAKMHGGAYGVGMRYAKSMLGAHATEASPIEEIVNASR